MKALARMGLFVAALGTVSIALELSLRVLGFNPLGGFRAREFRATFLRPSSNRQRVYEPVPDTSGPAWDTHVTFNRHGFRGREISTEKPDGTHRIAVLGDSITFGIGLPVEAIYPTLLESHYRSAGRAVEVMNLALGGYDPLQEVATLADVGLPLDPDLVVVGYCMNDISVASANLAYIERLERYDSWIYRSRLAQLVRVKLDRIETRRVNARARRAETFASTYEEYLADIGDDEELRSLTAALESALRVEGSDVDYWANYTHETHLRRLRFAFEQLQSLRAKSSGKSFDVVVLVFPFMLWNESHPETMRLIREIVRHEATRLGFRVLDLHPLFAAAGFESLRLEPGDAIHPNARAHHLVAEALFDFLEPGARREELLRSPERAPAPTGGGH